MKLRWIWASLFIGVGTATTDVFLHAHTPLWMFVLAGFVITIADDWPVKKAKK